MKNILIAFVTFLVAFVAAQGNTANPYYITAPLQGSSFKAGKTMKITWRNGKDQTITVALLAGSDPAAMQTTGYSFKVNGDEESYSWKLPTKISSQGTFALQFEFEDTDDSTSFAYSDPFTITGGTVTVSASPATASTAPPASGTAASSGTSATISNSSLSVTHTSSPTAANSSAGRPLASASPDASNVPNPENSAVGSHVTSLLVIAPVAIAGLFLA